MNDFFNSNRFTSKAMPICSELYSSIDSFCIDKVSDEMQAFRERTAPIYKKFFDSLSNEQQDMYNERYDCETEEYTIATTEHFNMGMCVGMRLALELLK